MKQGEPLTAVKPDGKRIEVIYSAPLEFGNHKVFCIEEGRYMCLVTQRPASSDIECELFNKVH